jgi:hypothetical protein
MGSLYPRKGDAGDKRIASGLDAELGDSAGRIQLKTRLIIPMLLNIIITTLFPEQKPRQERPVETPHAPDHFGIAVLCVTERETGQNYSDDLTIEVRVCSRAQ